jgi:hypothetical protein
VDFENDGRTSDMPALFRAKYFQYCRRNYVLEREGRKVRNDKPGASDRVNHVSDGVDASGGVAGTDSVRLQGEEVPE